MKKITAFTLGEVLIVIALVGVLASLLLPTLSNMQPDRRKLMFKKAYTTVDQIVTELVNDETFYPEALGKVGLDNTTTALNITATGLNGMTAQTKFCRLFAYKVNTLDESSVTCPATLNNNQASGVGSTPSFTTTEGIEYYIPNSDFSTSMRLYVDVNGAEPPNCVFNASTCSSPDRFSILIAGDGGLSVDGNQEREYLKSSTVVKDH